MQRRLQRAERQLACVSASFEHDDEKQAEERLRPSVLPRAQPRTSDRLPAVQAEAAEKRRLDVIEARRLKLLFSGDGVRRILRQAADQLSNKLSHAQHLDEVTWTTKNWHGLQMQRLSVVLHTAVAWQTVNELACGDSGIVHGAKCIAVLNGVA